jgi:hypothetical protein
MVGFYSAAAVVTLMQFLRVRDKRLLLLLALFLLQAAARARGSSDPWGLACDLVSGGAGLVLLWVLAPPHRRPPV